MGKYQFSRAKDDTLNVRMSSEVAKAIRDIAGVEKTTVQEVCRVFLEEALKDYLTQAAKEKDTTVT
jgi:hypothetical protein